MRPDAAALSRSARTFIVASLWLGTLVSAGCGQKGPLFLPDSEPTVVETPTPQPGTPPASEETKKKEEPR
jgi:predicted small lipoprotein YifL